MDLIEPDALYDERGEVSWARPILQGDVFDGIVLPGFGEEPMKVQVVNHPCAMRKGPNMLPRITVAPVEEHHQFKKQKNWDGSFAVMPLAELIDDKHFATKFEDVTAAPSELLIRSRRIATLSNKGIYVLQQRLIKHYTRFEVDLELLRKESASTLVEAELQWTWIDEVLTDKELADAEAIEAEEAVFDQWLGDGEPTRRSLLKDEINHTDLRKDSQRAARERSQTR